MKKNKKIIDKTLVEKLREETEKSIEKIETKNEKKECNRCSKELKARYSDRDPDEAWKFICPTCLIAIEKKQKWLSRCKKNKSLEERIACIEEWIYENNASERHSKFFGENIRDAVKSIKRN